MCYRVILQNGGTGKSLIRFYHSVCNMDIEFSQIIDGLHPFFLCLSPSFLYLLFFPFSHFVFSDHTSPKLFSLKCEFGDEAGEITIAVPPPPVCLNGGHAYSFQPGAPGSGKPAGSLGLGLLPKSLPLSISLQNLSPRASPDLTKGPIGDGRRWSFDKPGEEEKAAIAAALEQRGPMTGEDEERSEPAADSQASSSAESVSQGKKQRRNLFSHGSSESAGKGQSQSKDESEQAPAPSEEKSKGWFRSKESHSKPR